MVAKIDYKAFLAQLDKKLKEHFESHKDYIYCKEGCSSCCEEGDYPLSDIELAYLTEGISKLDNNIKIQVQNNIKNMERGGACPFLIDKKCSVYPYRPIICRIHGLAYLSKTKVKLPYCVKLGKNYSNVYKDGVLLIEPIKNYLDDYINIGEIRNLYDWTSASRINFNKTDKNQ